MSPFFAGTDTGTGSPQVFKLVSSQFLSFKMLENQLAM